MGFFWIRKVPIGAQYGPGWAGFSAGVNEDSRVLAGREN